MSTKPTFDRAKIPERADAEAEMGVLPHGDPTGVPDHIDRLVRAWTARIPELDSATLELALRTVWLDSALHQALSGAISRLQLTRTDFDVLTTLHARGVRGTIRSSELRAHILVSSGGATNILNRLERKGLITRVQDPYDARSRLVSLTKEGEALTMQAVRSYIDAHTSLFRDTTPSKAERAASALRDIMRTLKG